MNKHRFRHKTLGQIAVETPNAIPVFRQHKLDFCCGGDRLLETAAKESGVDAEILLSDLERIDLTANVNTDEQDIAGLCRIIVDRFHEKHRRELPELIRLAEKVESVHRERPSCPTGSAALLIQMYDEMRKHMEREEVELFPAISTDSRLCPATLIQNLENDHEELGAMISLLESMFSEESVPNDACTTWKALASGVKLFVDDLMEHVHLENNVLFPKLMNQSTQR